MLFSVRAMVLTQDNYLYRVWSVEAGLPQISVTSIVQDADGFLWLGTQNGLARFDGLQFEVFNTSNTAEMSSNVISELFIDSLSRLWIGTANGLMRYQDGKFERLDHAQPLQGEITGFSEMSDGRIYIGANRLHLWQQDKLEHVVEHRGPVFQLHYHDGILYIGGQDGFATLGADGYKWQPAPIDSVSRQVTEIETYKKQLYLGTSAGLYRWNSGIWSELELPGVNDGERIELLYVDVNKRFWVSTYSNMFY